MKVWDIYEGKWLVLTEEASNLIYAYSHDIDIRFDLQQILFSMENNNSVNKAELILAFEKYFKEKEIML